LLDRFSPREPTQPVLTVNERPGTDPDRRTATHGWSVLWQPGDVVELLLPMPLRSVETHEAVVENRGSVAVTRARSSTAWQGSTTKAGRVGAAWPLRRSLRQQLEAGNPAGTVL
jgi:DUF1680 family protein